MAFRHQRSKCYETRILDLYHKADDAHPRPFHMGIPPPPPNRKPGEQKSKKCPGKYSLNFFRGDVYRLATSRLRKCESERFSRRPKRGTKSRVDLFRLRLRNIEFNLHIYIVGAKKMDMT